LQSKYCREVCYGKTTMHVWLYPVVKNEDMCIRFDRMYERVRQTDGPTDTARRHRPTYTK